MSDKHLSSQFDAELNSISTNVLEMGGLVESQLHQAIYALVNMSLESALQVEENESRINQMEVSIDHEIISTIGRRQPTARDLRFLMAISRTTQNLERAGDEVARMARMARDRGLGRLDLNVLTWNPARKFYERLGIAHIDEWVPYRVRGDALDKLAALDSGG